MEEKVYYQDQAITVTQSRFVNNGTTYAMRNISSVRLGVIPANNTFAIILMVIGFLMLLGGGIEVKILGGAFMLLSIYLIKQAKPKYTILINSNSGEVTGLTSTDQEYIRTIIDHINTAIIHP